MKELAWDVIKWLRNLIGIGAENAPSWMHSILEFVKN